MVKDNRPLKCDFEGCNIYVYSFRETVRYLPYHYKMKVQKDRDNWIQSFGKNLPIRTNRMLALTHNLEIITTGRMVSAVEAKSMGLVNHVVPPEGLMNKCMEIANQILNNGPNAIAQSLNCIQKRMGMSMEDGLEIEVENFSKLFATEEAKEGLSAFVEKRKPNFRN